MYVTCQPHTFHLSLYQVVFEKKNITRFYLKIYHIAAQVEKIIKVRSSAVNVFFVHRRNKLQSQDVRHHTAQEVQGWHRVLDPDQLCSARGAGECQMLCSQSCQRTRGNLSCSYKILFFMFLMEMTVCQKIKNSANLFSSV